MEDPQLKMFVVYSQFEGSFYLALVPAALAEERIQTALRELGVEADALFELDDWRRTEDDVAVVCVPFPNRN